MSATEPKSTAPNSARLVRTNTWLVLRLLPQVSLGLTLVLGLLVLVGSAIGTGFMIATGRLVGSVPGSIESGLDSPAGKGMLINLGAVAILFAVQQVMGPLREALTEALGRRTDNAMRVRVMRAVLRPPGLRHLEDPRILDRIRQAQGVGIGHIPPGAAVVGAINNVSSYLRVVVAAVMVAFLFHWWLAAVLVASGLVIRRRLLEEGGKRVQVVMGQAHALRRSEYYRDLAITPIAAKELRVFGLHDFVVGRFSDQWLKVMTDLWSQRRRGTKVSLAWFLPAAAATAWSFWSIGQAGLAGMPLSRVAILTQAVLAAGTWFVTDNDLFLEHGAAALKPVRELEAIVESPELAFRGELPAGDSPKDSIRFDNVHFTYPAQTDEVLRGLDLEIKAGASTAIVGINGAGKTTLMKLICRLYDPSSGSIFVDEKDLRELDPGQWSKRIAAIFQDFVRYELPAHDNVGFGAIDHKDELLSIKRAARMAGAEDLIDGLPYGWDTILSREYTAGADLSGGEWQRVALARALFATEAGAGVLILDEPTAALDVRAEAALFDRFLDLTKGLTTILVSHRFSSVRHADRIVVIEEGRVIEDGSHDELMARSGTYARMFRLQASRFVDEDQDELEQAERWSALYEDPPVSFDDPSQSDADG